MVNRALPDGAGDARAAERSLAISYAPRGRRAGLNALLGLDAALGGVIRSTREPLVGQMRLAWWRDALTSLDRLAPPAEPVLQALADEVVATGVTGAALAVMVDGWEALLTEPLDPAALAAHAGRGAALFAAAAMLLRADAPQLRDAGEGWALADLAGKLSAPGLATEAAAMATARLERALRQRWPARLRALGALALLASLDLSPQARPAGHPARVARLLRLRLLGR